MVSTDPWTLGAGGVMALAVLQLLLGRWRDLGALTLTAGAILVVLALPTPPVAVWAGLSSAALVAAVAWARGASRGIGHPSVDSAVLGCGIAVATGAAALSSAPGMEAMVGPPLSVNVVGATVLGVIGAVATTLALRSPGARHRPVRWVGEIPIAVPKPPVATPPGPATPPDPARPPGP